MGTFGGVGKADAGTVRRTAVERPVGVRPAAVDPPTSRARPAILALAVGIAGAPVLVGLATVPAGAIEGYLPLAAWDLLLSFARMAIAYGLSLGFALSYGYLAASNRSAERVLIPTLDILQSVPIIGFFPIVLLVLVNIAGSGSWIGPNLASIFLIFTCMSWNMVFGVFESLKSIPQDIREASDSFFVTGRQRLRRLVLPATVNRLVYNSVLSWTGGWYFLVVAESFTTSSSSTSLPGIGSYLLVAAFTGNGAALVAGLALLVALIAGLDVFVWRPLGHWAEKYRYDQVPSGEGESTAPARRPRAAPLRRAAGFVYQGVVTGITTAATPLAGFAAYAVPARVRAPSEGSRRAARWVAIGVVLVLVWLLLITVAVGVFHDFTSPISEQIRGDLLLIPLALVASFGRLVVAYAISLAIALPLGIYLVRRPRVYRTGLPVIEVIASVPATALFPLLIFTLVPTIGFQGASILMLMTGMLWYLFFNLLSGLRSIPPDLEEAARSYGLSRRDYYRRLVLPAIFPAFVTGSITAFGGGWNTLIIAEYLHYGPTHSFQVLGIGELIDVGNATAGGGALLAAALLSMVITVIAVNELLWKPMYRRAIERYRLD